MKLITKKEEFKPFTITLEVESIEEARTLYHVFNNSKLDEVIKDKQSFYSMHDYNKELTSIANSQVTSLIRATIGSGEL